MYGFGRNSKMTIPKTLTVIKFTCNYYFIGQITALKIKHNPFAKAFLDAKER